MDGKETLYDYLLLLGDNPMILAHRLSELCGHGPNLETDIALTNISLDLFGQVRNYFQYASEIHGEGKTEDDIAFLRLAHQYRNLQLVEQPNTDFAHVICRQFLFDAYHLPLMETLTGSRDARVAAIAEKSLKEVRYHLWFSSEWVKRLGDGTAESHQRMQVAIDHLWPFTGELWEETPPEAQMKASGTGADLMQLKNSYHTRVNSVLKEATLDLPDSSWFHSGGKRGIHTEHLGYILSDLQYMQRAYPNMSW